LTLFGLPARCFSCLEGGVVFRSWRALVFNSLTTYCSCDLSSHYQVNNTNTISIHQPTHPSIMLCCFQSCFDDPQSAYSQQASSDDIVVRDNAGGGYPGQRHQFVKTGGNALAAAGSAAQNPQATAPASPQPPPTTTSSQQHHHQQQQQQQQPTDGELVSGKLLYVCVAYLMID
jgi:hypothetical protein